MLGEGGLGDHPADLDGAELRRLDPAIRIGEDARELWNRLFEADPAFGDPVRCQDQRARVVQRYAADLALLLDALCGLLLISQEGAPTVVVEIHSPGDEAYEKLPFYASLGVPEVWIIDRDTGRPEIHVLQGGEYVRQSPADDGWMRGTVTGVEFRCMGDRRVTLRMAGDEKTSQNLPED